MRLIHTTINMRHQINPWAGPGRLLATRDRSASSELRPLYPQQATFSLTCWIFADFRPLITQLRACQRDARFVANDPERKSARLNSLASLGASTTAVSLPITDAYLHSTDYATPLSAKMKNLLPNRRHHRQPTPAIMRAMYRQDQGGRKQKNL